MHKGENGVSLLKVPIDTRKEMLADWYAVSKHMSKDKEDFPDIKTWADNQGYQHMYKEAALPKFPKGYWSWSPARQTAWLKGDTYKLKELSSKGGKRTAAIRAEEQRLIKEHMNHPDTKHVMSWHKQDLEKNSAMISLKKLKRLKTRQALRTDLNKARAIRDKVTAGEISSKPEILSAANKVTALKVHNRKGVRHNSDWADLQQFKGMRKQIMAELPKTAEARRKRKNMPQVDHAHLKKKEKTTKIDIPLAALKPSQKDFNYKKVDGMAKALKKGDWEWSPILISNDFHIVDGHHRWKAALKLWGNTHKVSVLMLPYGRKEALDRCDEYSNTKK